MFTVVIIIVRFIITILYNDRLPQGEIKTLLPTHASFIITLDHRTEKVKGHDPKNIRKKTEYPQSFLYSKKYIHRRVPTIYALNSCLNMLFSCHHSYFTKSFKNDNFQLLLLVFSSNKYRYVFEFLGSSNEFSHSMSLNKKKTSSFLILLYVLSKNREVSQCFI